ncbi:MAG: thioredoxin family protein [Bacteroidota bacterium]|nr:thioredoxin family protein [Bacteroidota bacterium]
MRKIFLLPIAVAATIAISFQTADIKPIEIGTAIPKADVKMHDVLSGKEFSINDKKGASGTLVIFSCNTCPYVIAQEDRIREVQANASRMDIGVVIINSNEAKRDGDDSQDAMQKYGNNQKFMAPYLVDPNSELANAFGATRTPEMFLFDKDGKLAYRGSIDDSPREIKAVKTHYLLDAMTALSKGKEITTKTTVSSGCSIKRK